MSVVAAAMRSPWHLRSRMQLLGVKTLPNRNVKSENVSSQKNTLRPAYPILNGLESLDWAFAGMDRGT